MRSKSVEAMIVANTKHPSIAELAAHARGDTCIEWAGACNDRDYGQVSKNGKRLYVHRLVWEYAHGEIPAGICVLHKCDNPKCYNLDHLFLGTDADNKRDMLQKGRAATRYKLDAADIPVIRQRLADGEEQIKIAVDYKVSAATISAINCGRAWTWIF